MAGRASPPTLCGCQTRTPKVLSYQPAAHALKTGTAPIVSPGRVDSLVAGTTPQGAVVRLCRP